MLLASTRRHRILELPDPDQVNQNSTNAWITQKGSRQNDNEMKRRKHTPKLVVRKLREADRMIEHGTSIAEELQHLEVTAVTYYRWRD